MFAFGFVGSIFFFYGLVGSTAVIAILLWKFLVTVIGSLGKAMSNLMESKNQVEKDTMTLTTTTASMAAALQEKINELTEALKEQEEETEHVRRTMIHEIKVRDKDIIELQQKLKDTKTILEDRDIELHEVRRTMACEIDGRNKRNTALHRELEHSVKENEELKRVKGQNMYLSDLIDEYGRKSPLGKEVHITGHGTVFHVNRSCSKLKVAKSIMTYRACDVCSYAPTNMLNTSASSGSLTSKSGMKI